MLASKLETAEMKKRFDVLDSFRGVCAVSIVFFHLHFAGGITELQFFRGSSILVDFFFVLSGFVLAHSYGFKKNLSFTSFLSSRFFRIYPLHLAMLLLLVIFELVKLVIIYFQGFMINNPPFVGLNSVDEILPNLLLIHAWTTLTSGASFNYPSWSISIEFYTYLLFFLSLLVSKNNKFMIWFVISVSAFYFLYTKSPEFMWDVFQGGVFRGLSSFFGGALIYIAYKEFTDLKIGFVSASLIEFALLLGVIYIVQSNSGYSPLLASGCFLLTVFFFAFEKGWVSGFLKMSLFGILGRLSYSIYMIQAVVIIPIYFILHKIGAEVVRLNGMSYLSFGNEMLNSIAAFLIVFIVIACSHFTYIYILN